MLSQLRSALQAAVVSTLRAGVNVSLACRSPLTAKVAGNAHTMSSASFLNTSAVSTRLLSTMRLTVSTVAPLAP